MELRCQCDLIQVPSARNRKRDPSGASCRQLPSAVCAGVDAGSTGLRSVASIKPVGTNMLTTFQRRCRETRATVREPSAPDPTRCERRDPSGGERPGAASPRNFGETDLRGERMFDLIALRDNLARARFTFDGARDRFLNSLIVVLLNLFVVGRIPMDEYTDTDKQVVGFVGGDCAIGDPVRDRLGHRVLRRGGHLHGLFWPLDGGLVGT